MIELFDLELPRFSENDLACGHAGFDLRGYDMWCYEMGGWRVDYMTFEIFGSGYEFHLN